MPEASEGEGKKRTNSRGGVDSGRAVEKGTSRGRFDQRLGNEGSTGRSPDQRFASRQRGRKAGRATHKTETKSLCLTPTGASSRQSPGKPRSG